MIGAGQAAAFPARGRTRYKGPSRVRIGILSGVNRIIEIGPVAGRVLADGWRGRVVARFERSYYLRGGDDFVCFGGADVGSGPLNVLVDVVGPMPPAGAPASVERGALRIGAGPAIDLTTARRWMPAAPALAPRDAVDMALAELVASARPRAPAEGLSRLVLERYSRSATELSESTNHLFAASPETTPELGSPETTPELGSPGSSPVADARENERGGSRIAALGRGFRECKAFHFESTAGRLLDGLCAGADAAGPAGAVTGLIGLGPGLTPSGDDLIGGMLIGLAGLGEFEQRDTIWRNVEPQLATATSPLSAAHLRAAALGFGSAALHDLLGDLLKGDTHRLARHLDALGAIGHSSGFDALAGVVVALRM